MALALRVLLQPLAALPPLTVHIVPHTHDDCGWLKTFDAYYSGTDNWLHLASVRNILDAVVLSLAKEPSRRFTFVEQSFFQRWWSEQDDAQRSAARKLVESGQLQFANGGWCMHDEATTHFVDMIDQTTLGHRMIAEEFGAEAVPTVGWQLDPFGHSATQAALLSAEAGMDALFFGRISKDELKRRRASRSAEFIWRASPSLGADAQVFSGLTGEYGGNYVPPEGFDWATREGQDDPIEDNPNVSSYNAPKKLAAFLVAARAQANETRGRHIMWTMGADFTFANAEAHFRNIDRLIRTVNKDGRVLVRYSTPAEYVAAKRAEKVAWPLKNATDFFPYATDTHRVWSGYFTSRPTLKGYIRTASAAFGAARMLHALAAAAAFNGPASPSASLSASRASAAPLQLLEDALAVASHHDAVTGTSKQQVAYDYARRLAKGEAQADAAVSSALGRLLREQGVTWRRCARLNESVCEATQDPHVEPSTGGAGTFRIAVVNSLAQARREVVTLPVSAARVTVTSAAGERVPVQVYAAGETVTNFERNTKEAAHVASFMAQLPPLGVATYQVIVRAERRRRQKGPSAAAAAALLAPAEALPQAGARKPKPAAEHAEGQAVGANVTLSNEILELNFSRATGRLISMVNKAEGLTLHVEQSFCYYESNGGSRSSHGVPVASGAYIFSPNGTTCHPVASAATITAVVRGDVVQEVRQTFTPWLTQTVRLAAGWRFAEFEHTVGPVPLTSSNAPTVASPKEAGGGAAAEGGRDDDAKRARRATARKAARGVDLRRSVGGIEACAAALTGTEGHGGELGEPGPGDSYSAEEARNTVISICSQYVAGCSGAKINTGGGGLGRQQREMFKYAQLERTKELQAQTDEVLLGYAALRECRFGPGAAPSSCPHAMCRSHGKVASPLGLPAGREVVSRFVTNLLSAAEMLTDSNGREMMLRRRANASGPEPIASSYFPVTTAAAIRSRLKQLTLLVDRAAGAASLADGQLEIMVHRRLLADDDCGVSEPLNETKFVDELGRHSGPGLISRGTHRLTLERPARASRVWRPLADRTYARPLLAFARIDANAADADGGAGADGAPPRADVSALLTPLPAHVQLVTLQELRAGRLLLRLAHQLAIGEDAALAQPAQVNLATLFDPAVLRLEGASRRSLTNSHNESELMRRRQRARAWHTSGQPHAWRRLNVYNFSADPVVTLGPMEIHTFELELRPVGAS